MAVPIFLPINLLLSDSLGEFWRFLMVYKLKGLILIICLSSIVYACSGENSSGGSDIHIHSNDIENETSLVFGLEYAPLLAEKGQAEWLGSLHRIVLPRSVFAETPFCSEGQIAIIEAQVFYPTISSEAIRTNQWACTIGRGEISGLEPGTINLKIFGLDSNRNALFWGYVSQFELSPGVNNIGKIFLSENQPPTVSVTVKGTDGGVSNSFFVGEVIQFSANAKDPDGEIKSYSWNFWRQHFE
jgi:hypothetical protein